MTFLAVLFVAFVLTVAFVLNGLLDKRTEKKKKLLEQKSSPPTDLSR